LRKGKKDECLEKKKTGGQYGEEPLDSGIEGISLKNFSTELEGSSSVTLAETDFFKGRTVHIGRSH